MSNGGWLRTTDDLQFLSFEEALLHARSLKMNTQKCRPFAASGSHCLKDLLLYMLADIEPVRVPLPADVRVGLVWTGHSLAAHLTLACNQTSGREHCTVLR